MAKSAWLWVLLAVWLLANCALVVTWPHAGIALWLGGGCLLWLFGFVSLVVCSLIAKAAWRQRLAMAATVVVGAAIAWDSPWLGPRFHVWWFEAEYLAQVREALASPPSSSNPGLDVEVDHRDSPPVRVAFFKFAAHGDVMGIVHDPTGLVATERQDWLYGSRARHLFGPWYLFAN